MIKWHAAPNIALLKSRILYNKTTGIFTRRTPGRIIMGRLNKTTGYWTIGFDKKQYQAHRLAWFYVTGKWPTNDIDHINGIRTDNRFENLREATRSQNCRNRVKHKGKSLPLGVYRNNRGRRTYYVQILANGRNKRLGPFKSVVEAEAAYLQASFDLAGQYSPNGR